MTWIAHMEEDWTGEVALHMVRAQLGKQDTGIRVLVWSGKLGSWMCEHAVRPCEMRNKKGAVLEIAM